jgi:hypothetical protein
LRTTGVVLQTIMESKNTVETEVLLKIVGKKAHEV